MVIWNDLSYYEDTVKHKKSFFEWILKHGLWFDYSRVRLTVSCNDADYIPKHPDAGKVFDTDGHFYQLMHNGIKVVKDGYCASWMTDVIYGLKGHHEPQEEKVFYEILKYIPSKAVMIELGSYWAYYSLWFSKEVAEPTTYMIEPDPERLDLGRKNFALNDAKGGTFIRGHVGYCSSDAGDFQGSREIYIDSFLEENNIDHVNILHSDIQGSEYQMLETAVRSIGQGKIDYFFISTHSEEVHHACLNFLKAYNYHIIAEHTPEESYSVDGLIVGRRNGVPGPDAVAISKKRGKKSS
jgi:hypothetical protein